ncbi:hypothetical protein CF65_01733 [Aggregatibacter actinomycetemcomitans HK1651]|nr:hypothetical protein ANH9381_1393 [Aggregatibacter actinomycetemcomitans ANH9381]AHN72015.1 hypothetical protein CF65_01733 [Aggregatibacter actinomycetemcomitans HK1651]
MLFGVCFLIFQLVVGLLRSFIILNFNTLKIIICYLIFKVYQFYLM